MNNPEQQLNTESNLQTLETELSLTQAEMEEFRKLPKEEQEKQKDEKLEKLKALQEKLDEAIQEAIMTGEIDEARNLKEVLENEIENLEEIFYESFETKISTIYVYKDESGEEIVENIRIDFEQKFVNALKFYNNHHIDIPAGFESEIKAVWAENIDEMREQIEKFGFDEILIIPGGLKIDEDLDKELTADYKKKNGRKGDPTHWEISKEDIKSDARSDQNRIILVHKNIAGDLREATGILPILKETLGKSGGDFKPEEGMTIEEYFVFQRAYFEETGNHLDGVDGVTWLPGSRVGSRVVRAYFNPDDGQVRVAADGAGHSFSFVGCRPSRSFFKK